MDDAHFEFSAELWEHDGPAAWFFISVPDDVADDIDERFAHRAAGFGSIRVQVTIGGSRWRTSLFPDTKRATFLLPVKKAVRKAEGIDAGATVDVELDVLA